MVLLITAAINFFIPYKLAFLNIYFLPIILGGYYLGKRLATLGAFLSILMVVAFVYLKPELFYIESNNIVIYAQVAIWGGFLILAGVVVGSLHERLIEKVNQAQNLNNELQLRQDELGLANLSLKDHSENLEQRVKERTFELEQSRNTIETMKQKVEDALYSTMDPMVVNLMIEGRLQNEKRDVSLLFSDLVNFTAYSENTPPEVLIGDLNRYLRDMEPIIHAYHGHIDKYMGDGIMCEFGAPVGIATFRTMYVVAAVKMQQQIRKLDHPWEMRVGIATGPAFTGLIGGKRQTYTAIGDAVNLASRLEKACMPGGILIDRNTYESVAYCLEARKRRKLGIRQMDIEKTSELVGLLEKLEQQPGDGDVHYQVACLELELNEPEEAIRHLEHALELDPGNTGFKLLYAEAGLKTKEMERITVKGKRHCVEAYEIVGFKDPFNNREKIPEKLRQELTGFANLILIPDDLILPVEVLEDLVGRSRVVGALSYMLAETMGLSGKDKLDIANAAFLSDIGKEAIPPHLLNRSNNLAKNELDIFRQHPVEGGRILRKLGYENPALIQIVTHVHECWNGNGYPNGLFHDNIPLGSRIIAVANAYDSLTSHRIYRQPWARHAALGEIHRETELGIFDPSIVALLTKLLNSQ
jgi:class 3 adenylate cyclase